jgi:hypothetical protein
MSQFEQPGDVAEFFRLYPEAWNSADLDLIANAYATPCFVVKSGQVVRHKDPGAKHRYFADLLAGNQQQGAHTWSIRNVEERPLGRGASMAMRERQWRGTSSRAGAAGSCAGVAAQLARRLRASSERLPGSAVKTASRSPVSAASSMTS